MKNTKIIIVVLVIIVVGIVAYVIGHRQGAVVTGAQSASISKATAVINPGQTSRFNCWLYGGTWKEYAGGHMDCNWATTAK